MEITIYYKKPSICKQRFMQEILGAFMCVEHTSSIRSKDKSGFSLIHDYNSSNRLAVLC